MVLNKDEFLKEYNIDENQLWEIHPAYRSILKIR